jgi:hypothetical protein
MTKSDRDRTDARTGKAGGYGKTTMIDRDATTKATLDNMARLKALRLAREAAAPPQPLAAPKKARAKAKTPAEKAPALGDWLAGQQSGGRRT